jgi:hypothetical protein
MPRPIGATQNLHHLIQRPKRHVVGLDGARLYGQWGWGQTGSVLSWSHPGVLKISPAKGKSALSPDSKGRRLHVADLDREDLLFGGTPAAPWRDPVGEDQDLKDDAERE